MKKYWLVVSWDGFPQYAARLVRAVIERIEVPCLVIGTHPNVPIDGMEDALGQAVTWVDGGDQMTWSQLGLKPPSIFIQSGWNRTAFSSLGREVKRAGGLVIGLSDANWRADYRQLVLGPIAFRLLYKSHFDGMIVPGSQGTRLMKYFGVDKLCIREGMYGADSSIFKSGPPLNERSKTILYVGQFIERKNVLRLVDAFLKFVDKYPEWKLHLVGSGSLKNKIPKSEGVVVEDFVQPEKLARYYQDAKFFVLPSLVEAWGLVVHEATLCGCGLLLSNAVGSAPDLSNDVNSVKFDPRDTLSIQHAFDVMASMDEVRLSAVELESYRLSCRFGPDRFAESFFSLVDYLSVTGNANGVAREK
ncbi:glycosyltransferase [Chlorobium sp. N1]|uniref:glycosyltransferase n=1 Tax=Chlorobium sp. N1 TaxID=2491138 RepID=UPI0013F1771A|nr:glycosyltransferase [Chlorobium sp. N1]